MLWAAPQVEWQLVSHDGPTIMPNYNANIKLYYKFEASDADVRYNTPTKELEPIMIDGLPAFCLNRKDINPKSYKNIPYKAPIAFSEATYTMKS